MSEYARRASAQVIFNGVDITDDIRPYLLSLSFTDNEEDESDDLQIQMQDREGLWLQSWLQEAVNASVNERLKIKASIITEDGDRQEGLDCGEFELDSISCAGPPSTVTLKAVALPFSSRIRQTKQSQAWENYYLSKIASEIAARSGFGVMYLSQKDPLYQRVEQYRTADIAFLSTLCKNAGISLKVTNGSLVLFDQAAYEAKPAVFTVKLGDGSYSRYRLMVGEADTQYDSCRVSYVDPILGSVRYGTATVQDYDEKSKNNQQLEIFAKVADIGEATELAKNLLRAHNKFSKTANFTLRGKAAAVAGQTVLLESFGGFDGKYMIRQAKHVVSAKGGFTTQISLRHVLVPESEEAAKSEYSVGDIVWFLGGSHYVSSDAVRATRTDLAPGWARITLTNPGSAHPWHLIHTDDASRVYGWVNDGSFTGGASSEG